MVAVIPDVAPTGRYTPTEAAKLLGVDRKTIYRAMDSDELKYTASPNRQKRYIRGLHIRQYFLSH